MTEIYFDTEDEAHDYICNECWHIEGYDDGAIDVIEDEGKFYIGF